jgi:hypothetical protein
MDEAILGRGINLVDTAEQVSDWCFSIDSLFADGSDGSNGSNDRETRD